MILMNLEPAEVTSCGGGGRGCSCFFFTQPMRLACLVQVQERAKTQTGSEAHPPEHAWQLRPRSPSHVLGNKYTEEPRERGLPLTGERI